jgi:hypothetical protein
MPIANLPAEPPAAAARVKPLDPAGVQLAEHAYRTWRVEIDPKTTPTADLFGPQFWANATKIDADDRIRVVATDKSFDFELVVKGRMPGLGLLVESNDATNPASPTYQVLMRIQSAVQAETDAQRAALNQQHGIAE